MEGEASYDLNDDGSILKTVFSFDEQTLQAAAARDEEEEEEEAVILANRSMEDAGRKSSFFPDFKSELKAASNDSNLGDGQFSQRFSRIYSSDALQIGLLLAQQEEKYGTNMFVSISKDDQEELNELKEDGMTTDQAAMKIFKRKCDDGEILPLAVSVEGESTDTGADKIVAENHEQITEVRKFKVNTSLIIL